MINRAVLLFSFSLILIGCSNDTKDLKHYMNQIKLKKGNEIAAAPVCSVLPKFQFPDNDNRRDPFILIKQHFNYKLVNFKEKIPLNKENTSKNVSKNQKKTIFMTLLFLTITFDQFMVEK